MSDFPRKTTKASDIEDATIRSEAVQADDAASEATSAHSDSAADASGSSGQNTAQQSAASEFSDLIDDLKDFIGKTAGAAADGDTEELKNQFNEKFEKVRQRMGEHSRTFTQSSKEFGEKAKEQIDEGLEHSKQFVQERPLSSVAIAAAGGLLIGLLLSAGRKKK